MDRWWDQVDHAALTADDLLCNHNVNPAAMSIEDWRLLCREVGFPGLREQLDTVPPFNPRRVHAGDIGYHIAPEE